jgi:hypothetical protein
MKSKFDCFVEMVNEHMNPSNTLTVAELKQLLRFAEDRYDFYRKKSVNKSISTLNEVQEIQMRLMEIASFNGFDGKKVVKLLRDNSDLWDGAIFSRIDDLISLRDIQAGDWNADTLYVLAKRGKEDDLEKLANLNFDADDISWIGSDKACKLLGWHSQELGGNSRIILQCWWD